MKLYILYIFSAIANFWIVMLYWGVSAGFASYIPIISLISSICLLTIATPILVFNINVGILIGLIFCLAIFPHNFISIINVLGNKNYYNIGGAIAILPTLVNIITIVLLISILINKNYIINQVSGSSLKKYIMAGIPIGFSVIYFIAISKNIKLK